MTFEERNIIFMAEQNIWISVQLQILYIRKRIIVFVRCPFVGKHSNVLVHEKIKFVIKTRTRAQHEFISVPLTFKILNILVRIHRVKLEAFRISSILGFDLVARRELRKKLVYTSDGTIYG